MIHQNNRRDLMSSLKFSSDIPEEIQSLVEQQLRSLINNIGLVRKTFSIDTFKKLDDSDNEKLIVKTETTKNGIKEQESFFILLNKYNPNLIEFSFNTNSFYSPSRYMKDFDNIDEIKHNAIILFNKITDLVKDKKNYLVSLSSFYKDRTLIHKIIIQKSDQILNQIEVTEQEVELALTKGFSSFLVKFKLDILVVQ